LLIQFAVLSGDDYVNIGVGSAQRARVPSGAERSPKKVVFFAFLCWILFAAAMAEPPVAGMFYAGV
jgi:hypothetical protein